MRKKLHRASAKRAKPGTVTRCEIVTADSGGRGRRCTGEVIARGMCRKHYERWRRWGDPLVVGKSGGPRFTPEELTIAGITTRQRNHWASTGVIGIEQDPRTGRYLWTDTTTTIAVMVKRLLDAGIDLDNAGRVAQGVVRDGAERVEIADGIWIGVDYEPAPAL